MDCLECCCCCCLCCFQEMQDNKKPPAKPPVAQTISHSEAATQQPVEDEIIIESPKPEPAKEDEIVIESTKPETTSSDGPKISEASLKAPEKAEAGSTIEVHWTGPNNSGDYIGVSKHGEEGYLHYSYLYDKSPVKLLLPAEPGVYDLKYMVEAQNNKVLAVRTIELKSAMATVKAPDKAEAGSTIAVHWTGPNNSGDYIGVSKHGEDGYLQYSYLYDKSPVKLLLPAEPGLYDLKYMMEAHNNKVLAIRTIELEAASASIEAPATAMAATTVLVFWKGPANSGDYIGISRLGEEGYLQYTYLYENNPVELTLPPEPGNYEIKYMLEAHNNKTLARKSIVLSSVEASLSAPSKTAAGSTVSVAWTGPDNDNDYIGVSKAGQDGYIDYVYLSHKSPVQLTLPTEPGSYDLKYMMERHDNKVVAKHRIQVE